MSLTKVTGAILPLSGITDPDGYKILGEAAAVLDLRNIEPTDTKQKISVRSYLAGGNVGGGMFYYDSSDSTSADNGGTIIVTAGGKRWKRVMVDASYYFSDFGADPTGLTDSTDAVQRAYTSLTTARNKTMSMRAGDRYMIKNTISVPQSVVTLGSRRGMTQGWGTLTTNGPDRAQQPDGSAFIWKGPESVVGFTVKANCVFSGITFAWVDENWFATKDSDLKKWGTCIESTERALNVVNCIYYGMTDFCKCNGEANFFESNYGFCSGTAYYITQSADVNRFTNCHHNPNVTRPPMPYVNLVGNRDSYFANLYQHDESAFLQCHSIATRTFVKTAGPTRLVGLEISNCIIDRTGCLVDIDTASSSQVSINNTLYICDYAKNTATYDTDGTLLTRTVDSDAGGLIFRQTTASSNVFSVKISGCNFTFANHPFALHPNYMFNFVTIQGYMVEMRATNVANLANSDTSTVGQMNNYPWYNVLRGELVYGIRRYSFESNSTNFVSNPSMANRNVSGGQPTGWSFVSCTIPGDSTGITSTSSVDGAAYASVSLNKSFSGNRTYMVSAFSVGNSPGVTFNLANNDGSSTVTQTVPWVNIGNKWYAIYRNSDTTMNNHEIRILIGGNTNRIVFDYAAICNGDITTYDTDMNEVEPARNTTGVNRYAVLIQANTPYTMPSTFTAVKGAGTLYISGPNGVAQYNIMKNDATVAGTVTEVQKTMSGASTYTVTWPANSQPVIQISAAATLTIVYVGI